jgi:hypothetical protein
MAESADGAGTADDPDVPQGRLGADVPEQPTIEAWQAAPVTNEQLRNGINVIPPALRPRVILRYADNRDLLVSGLVENGTEIAQHPAVVDAPLDKGHVLLFSNNPIWRGETHGATPGVQRADELRSARRRRQLTRSKAGTLKGSCRMQKAQLQSHAQLATFRFCLVHFPSAVVSAACCPAICRRCDRSCRLHHQLDLPERRDVGGRVVDGNSDRPVAPL